MKKITILCILLIVIPLFADDAVTLNVMSFNIRYGTANDGLNSWQNRTDLVFNVIRDHNPDIVGLQEALKFQIDAILDSVPGYINLGVGRDNGKTEGEYSSILYKADKFNVLSSGTFWFSDTPDVIGSKSWGNNITRICTWAQFTEKSSGKTFYFYNLHLDHQSQNSRVKSTALLAHKLAEQVDGQPFIITGDFNAGEDNGAITFLVNPNPPEILSNVLPVLDSFRVLFPDAEDVGTFNGFAGRTSGDKIDYVFVSSNIKTVDAAILHDNTVGQYPSDHFPVSAKIQF
jgi:endonuclease/exonuclease/phosphatase family metal-dependent hydrolase